MKLFKNANPNIKCDLISVDGRHYHEGSGTPHTHATTIGSQIVWSVHASDRPRFGVWLRAVEDINSFQFLANPDFNLLFVDDTNCKARYCFDSAVEEHLRRGTVRPSSQRPLCYICWVLRVRSDWARRAAAEC